MMQQPKPQQSFIFGGNTGRTYEDVQRMRANANALAPTGGSRNVAEGMSAMGQALMSRIIERNADMAEKQGKQEAGEQWLEVMAQPIGQRHIDQVAELANNSYLNDAQREVMSTLLKERIEQQLRQSRGPAQMSALDRARLEGLNLANKRTAWEFEQLKRGEGQGSSGRGTTQPQGGGTVDTSQMSDEDLVNFFLKAQ